MSGMSVPCKTLIDHQGICPLCGEFDYDCNCRPEQDAYRNRYKTIPSDPETNNPTSTVSLTLEEIAKNAGIFSDELPTR